MYHTDRILIIEDDFHIRRAVANALSETARTITEASTGREGIERAAADHPDLIVLDLGLPDGDGR